MFCPGDKPVQKVKNMYSRRELWHRTSKCDVAWGPWSGTKSVSENNSLWHHLEVSDWTGSKCQRGRRCLLQQGNIPGAAPAVQTLTDCLMRLGYLLDDHSVCVITCSKAKSSSSPLLWVKSGHKMRWSGDGLNLAALFSLLSRQNLPDFCFWCFSDVQTLLLM